MISSPLCLLNERLPFLLANQYIISQPLLSQPQPAPHKHETEVANPQYLLYWHHLIPQNQIAAVYVPRSGRKKPQRMLPNPDTKCWTCQVKAEMRQCPSLPPLTDPFANSRTAAFAVPRQQRDQNPGEREPECPRERTPGGIRASVREAYRSAHSQRSRACILSQTSNTKNVCIPTHKIMRAGTNTHPKSLLLLARHNYCNEYWQTTPNMTDRFTQSSCEDTKS